MHTWLFPLMTLLAFSSVEVTKTIPVMQEGTSLYISMNFNDGAYLILTDGKGYEINPEDRIYSELWIIPFPVEVEHAEEDSPYPILITNLNSKTTVRAKPIAQELVEQLQHQKPLHVPQPKIERPPPESKPKSPQVKPSRPQFPDVTQPEVAPPQMPLPQSPPAPKSIPQ